MIKRFISYYKPHKKLFILDMICAFLVAAMDLVFPMLTNFLLKDAIPNKNLRTCVMLLDMEDKFTFIDKENRETQSKFVCKSCGHEENADINASKVLLSRGLREYG